jgi:hypothetical protein
MPGVASRFSGATAFSVEALLDFSEDLSIDSKFDSKISLLRLRISSISLSLSAARIVIESSAYNCT